MGKQVSEDVALVGFDGIAEALSGQTRITTNALTLRALVVQAFQGLSASDLA